MDIFNSVLAEVILIGGALGALTQWVVRPLIRMIRSIHKGVTFIEEQLQNNHGRSLRDAMDRTEARFVFLFDHLGIEAPEHLRTPPPNPLLGDQE